MMKKSNELSAITELLERSAPVYAATVGLDGRPQLRPVCFLFQQDGALYFLTAKSRRLYAELCKSPNIQLCVSDHETETCLRISGKVCFTEDPDLILRCIRDGAAWRIRKDGRIVGGLVLRINESTQHNHLDLLFVNPDTHSKGIGFAAWKEVERLYPDTKVWETCTPSFETRNIHFYVNKCGFHIVEFFNSHHPDPHDPETGEEETYEEGGGMFRFEKMMEPRKPAEEQDAHA